MDVKALSNTRIELFMLYCEELVHALPNSETAHSKCHRQTLPSWCHLTLGTQLGVSWEDKSFKPQQLGYG